ncbi:hypothetical protein [Algisphaera agarilytica]|uniref:Uncharacterized protein n=1 Tax=Algisphaera agarilytica TaxID=1385975 RepID=A0A7X0H863_9BACT|nr:hypothetical protein [Algisphaera agarilytica]MBB6429594.1 hypothetical protein [Algisphaera agarilytica]
MEYVNLVLPEVPRNSATTRHWLKWGAGGKDHGVREGLWEMTGKAYNDEFFGVKGETPVCLNIWYDPAITDEIKQLVQELQNLEAGAEIIDNLERLKNHPPERQIADLTIPPHPKREALIGEWASEGETVYTIEEQDGKVLIKPTQSPPWESMINNLRWEEDVLRFDEYYYLDDPENPGYVHPFSGVRNDSSLTPQTDPDRLIYLLNNEHLEEPIGDEFTRVVN